MSLKIHCYSLRLCFQWKYQKNPHGFLSHSAKKLNGGPFRCENNFFEGRGLPTWPKNKRFHLAKKYLALYNSLQSDWLTGSNRNEVRSKMKKWIFKFPQSAMFTYS